MPINFPINSQLNVYRSGDSLPTEGLLMKCSAVSGWDSIGVSPKKWTDVALPTSIKYIDNRATGTGDGSTPENAYTTIAASEPAPGRTMYFVHGSGPYREKLEFRSSGTITDNVTWELNGCTVSAMEEYNNPLSHKWVLSSSGTNEYYLTLATGANPSLVTVKSCLIGGVAQIESAGDIDHDRGALGSLNDLQHGWGDNDSLGFSTLYVRSNSGNPHDVGLDIEASQRDYCISDYRPYNVVRGGVFIGGNSGTVQYNGQSLLHIDRCVLVAGNYYGVKNGGATPVLVTNCVGVWPGHDFVVAGGAGDLTVLNSVDWGAHLFCLIDTAASGTVTIKNCIGANEEAGAIDKKSVTATLMEDYNCWYPRMTAAGGALGYISTANWTTTGPNSIPPNHPTTENNQANLADPLLVLGTNNTIGNDLSLQTLSPCSGTDPYVDGDGDRYDADGYMVWSDTFNAPVYHARNGLDMGAYQRGGGSKVYNHPAVVSGDSMLNFVWEFPICPTIYATDDGTFYTGISPNQINLATFLDTDQVRAGSKYFVAYDSARTSEEIIAIDRYIGNNTVGPELYAGEVPEEVNGGTVTEVAAGEFDITGSNSASGGRFTLTHTGWNSSADTSLRFAFNVSDIVGAAYISEYDAGFGLITTTNLEAGAQVVNTNKLTKYLYLASGSSVKFYGISVKAYD
jgi:hypothetical protein